jgi:hypothetical protein
MSKREGKVVEEEITIEMDQENVSNISEWISVGIKVFAKTDINVRHSQVAEVVSVNVSDFLVKVKWDSTRTFSWIEMSDELIQKVYQDSPKKSVNSSRQNSDESSKRPQRSSVGSISYNEREKDEDIMRNQERPKRSSAKNVSYNEDDKKSRPRSSSVSLYKQKEDDDEEDDDQGRPKRSSAKNVSYNEYNKKSRPSSSSISYEEQKEGDEEDDDQSETSSCSNNKIEIDIDDAEIDELITSDLSHSKEDNTNNTLDIEECSASQKSGIQSLSGYRNTLEPFITKKVMDLLNAAAETAREVNKKKGSLFTEDEAVIEQPYSLKGCTMRTYQLEGFITCPLLHTYDTFILYAVHLDRSKINTT